MMLKSLMTFTVFLWILTYGYSNEVNDSNNISKMPEDLFRLAVEMESTAPNFVIVTVFTDSITKIISVEIPFLRGALHREHNLQYDFDSQNIVDSLLLAGYFNGFHFTSIEALNNIGFSTYSEEYYQKTMKTLNRFDLITLNDSLYLEEISKAFDENRYSARFIIESGFLVRRGCLGNYLFLDDRGPTRN